MGPNETNSNEIELSKLPVSESIKGYATGKDILSANFDTVKHYPETKAAVILEPNQDSDN
jgi:hypothetical protein